MLRHLISKHDAKLVDAHKDGQAIDKHFPKAAPLEVKTALVFAMNPALPLRLVEDEFFIQAFGHQFGRKGLPSIILDQAKGAPFAL